MRYEQRDFSALVGETIKAVSVIYNGDLGDEIDFYTLSGRKFRMHHYQECSETVDIKEISGELGWMINQTILQADMSKSGDEYKPSWTFYRLACLDGYATISWKGNSNGYYSEEVSFEECFQD